MKVIVIAHRNQSAQPKEFEPFLQEDSNHVLKLIKMDVIREVYSRNDKKGAIMVVECKDEDDAKQIMSELPLFKANLLNFEIYGVSPYRGIVQHVS